MEKVSKRLATLQHSRNSLTRPRTLRALRLESVKTVTSFLGPRLVAASAAVAGAGATAGTGHAGHGEANIVGHLRLPLVLALALALDLVLVLALVCWRAGVEIKEARKKRDG